MALDADHLLDRRRLKRRLTLWRALAIIGALALIAVLFADRLSGYVAGPHVARLAIHGLIIDDRERIAALRRLAEDNRARALIIRLDSPGGTTQGAEELYLALREVAERKPVVAVIGAFGASAAYLAALAADHIVARTTSLTGSIGVLVETAEFSGLLDSFGITTDTVKSGALKSEPSPLRPMSEEGRAVLAAVVEDSYQWFVALVAERRHLDRADALALADGRIFTGRQALAAGLLDALGGEAEARDWLAETSGVSLGIPTRDIAIERREGLWRLLRSAGKTLLSERLTLDGLVSVWQPPR